MLYCLCMSASRVEAHLLMTRCSTGGCHCGGLFMLAGSSVSMCHVFSSAHCTMSCSMVWQQGRAWELPMWQPSGDMALKPCRGEFDILRDVETVRKSIFAEIPTEMSESSCLPHCFRLFYTFRHLFEQYHTNV